MNFKLDICNQYWIYWILASRWLSRVVVFICMEVSYWPPQYHRIHSCYILNSYQSKYDMIAYSQGKWDEE